MPKGNRTIIQLVSSANTGYVYTTTKNKRKSQEKLQLKKYDPRVRKHVLFVEGKP
ncbi:50S ribosomal protein L33 [Corallococcus exercitus]|uniref:50S ribosomal protein L33 n=1 Tax=Corallococcus exercitus TaxID=2316736 RepID=UPI0035D473C1